MKTHRTPVYVVNRKCKPLDPTYRFGHVRKLLKTGKAVPICNNPFTIRLKYETPDITMGLYGGIDPGRENVGLSASEESGKCDYLSDVRTNNKSVKKNMADRAGFRRERRRHDRQGKQRKAKHDGTEIQNGKDDICRTTHPCKSKNVSYPGAENPVTHKIIQGKEGKFNNRKRPDDWITPSARQLIQTTVNSADRMTKIMPIKELHVERVAFDFQKLEDEDIRRWEYGKGPLYGFDTYKDYIFAEQHGKCLLCGAPIEEYHHIMPRKDGRYDHVSNIAGVCRCCHHEVHNDPEMRQKLLDIKKGAVQEYQVGLLNSVMPALIDALQAFCDKKGIKLVVTDGKETKKTREKYSLEKNHCIDAYAISLSGRNVDKKNISVPDTVYMQRRFKKKSKNMIAKRNHREYWYDGKMVAANRHKAEDQTKDSFEEYMEKYAETHTEKECEQHRHEVEVRPARRTYTYHKQGLRVIAHPGDLVSYTKKNKIKGNTKHGIVVAESVRADDEGGHVDYAGGKSYKSIYCRPVGSGSVQYTDTEKLESVLKKAKKEQELAAKKRAEKLAKHRKEREEKKKEKSCLKAV